MEVRQKAGSATLDQDAYTGPRRQITVDTDRWELRVHDNVTPGGHRILNRTQTIALIEEIIGDGNITIGDIDGLQTALEGILDRLDAIEADGWVTDPRIGDGEVKSRAIANGAVGNTQLGADAVTSNKILNGTIQPEDLGFSIGTPQSLGYLAVGEYFNTSHLSGAVIVSGGVTSGSNLLGSPSGTFMNCQPWSSTPGGAVGSTHGTLWRRIA